MSNQPHIVTAENATLIRKWMRERGGIQIFRSINLSNPAASWTVPVTDEAGQPVGKPNWQSANEPERVITSEEDILVSEDEEIKRFHVGVRPSSQGFSLKVTDGGSRRINREVAKAGDGAYYVFDYSSQDAVIMRPKKQTKLSEWRQS